MRNKGIFYSFYTVLKYQIMWKFWKPDSGKNKEFEKLVVGLKRVEKPQMSAVQKTAMKAYLISCIQAGTLNEMVPSSYKKLAKSVSSESARVQLSDSVLFALRERIFETIDRVSFESFGDMAFGHRYLRSMISAVLLFVFSVTAVFVFPFATPLTYASATYLDDVSGQVMVKRGDRMIEGKSTLFLQQGDVIVTKPGSYATVHFFDDSIGRLNENTNIELRELAKQSLNPLATQVKVFLGEGRLWSRVVNLIDEQSVFTVETAKVRADVSRKASFDVSAVGGVTEVAVFDNVVDVAEVHGAVESVSKTVVAGFKAEVPASTSSLQVSVLPTDQVSNTVWVAQNLKQDDTYDKVLFYEKEQNFGNALEANVLDATEDEVTNPEVVISTPEIEQAKLDFLDSYKRLLLSETMLVRGQHKDGLIELRNFRRSTGDLIAQLPGFHVKNDFDATLLEGMVSDKIAQQLKDMASFVPGDKLYNIKKVLQQIDIDLQPGDLAKTEKRLSHAEDRLLEIQQLLKDSQYTLSVATLRDYQDLTAQLVLKVDEVNFEEMKSDLVDLVAKQVQQLKVLTVLEQNKIEDNPDFNIMVKTVRGANLRKLIASLEQLKGAYSNDVILELKDLFDTYLAETGDYEDFVMPAFDKLLGTGDGQVSFISPTDGSVPQMLGVVVIVPSEATSDAVSVPVVVPSSDPVPASDSSAVSSAENTSQKPVSTVGVMLDPVAGVTQEVPVLSSPAGLNI